MDSGDTICSPHTPIKNGGGIKIPYYPDIPTCLAPDKRFVSGKYFSYFSMKIYVVGTH